MTLSSPLAHATDMEPLVLDQPTLGERLRFARRELLMSQAELAEESGLSKDEVSKLERGQTTRPHFSTIKKLARALGVDARQLYRGKR
jgi:transcriptional regulator with XRE-family HTH domain